MEHLMLSSTLQRELRAMRLLLAGSYPPTCQPVPLKAPLCTVALLSCGLTIPPGHQPLRLTSCGQGHMPGCSESAHEPRTLC